MHGQKRVRVDQILDDERSSSSSFCTELTKTRSVGSHLGGSDFWFTRRRGGAEERGLVIVDDSVGAFFHCRSAKIEQQSYG